MENIKVECVNCEDVHFWEDRTKIYEEEFCWTKYLCPVCGEEGYYEIKKTGDEQEQCHNNEKIIAILEITINDNSIMNCLLYDYCQQKEAFNGGKGELFIYKPDEYYTNVLNILLTNLSTFQTNMSLPGIPYLDKDNLIEQYSSILIECGHFDKCKFEVARQLKNYNKRRIAELKETY